MNTSTKAPEFDLYDHDFYAWCVEQAALLRARASDGSNDGLDYANLAEEIESLGRSDKRAIRLQTRVLLTHLLQWRYQPDKRSSSWSGTIRHARREIEDLVNDSPSLRHYPAQIVAQVLTNATEDAARETDLPTGTFPVECPFTTDEIFDPDFLPTNDRG